jgi:hypothetical protein
VVYGDFWARCAPLVDEVIAAARDAHQASLFAVPNLEAWYEHVGILRRRLDTLYDALGRLDEEASK